MIMSIDSSSTASDPNTGASVAHDSAIKHVLGQARYVDDMPRIEGQLYMAIGGSTIASGTVTHIDLSPVLESEGVVDVIRVGDIPGHVDIGPVFPGDPLLSDDISFHGQAIFAVVATSQTLARKAVRHAIIEYEESTPLLDIREALAAKAYVRPPHRMQRGDAQSALANAPHRLQGELEIGGQEHFYLEGQVALAVPTEEGGIQLYSSNQNPTETQKLVAEVCDLTMQLVTVDTRRMGGGFGGKETQAAGIACLAALFALRLNAPVACRLSRRDDFVMTGKRHPFLCQYDVGFDQQGRILGISYVLAGLCGHSPDLSDAIVDRAMFHCDNAYFFPHVEITGLRLRSNTVSNTAFRGFGGPQGMLVAETMIEHIAVSLQCDSLDIRERNFYGRQERNLTPYHQQVDTFTVPSIVEQLKTTSQYDQRRETIRTFNQQHTRLKRGIAMTPVKFGISFTVTHLNQAGALLHLYSDGTFQLNHGGTEMGQGLMTKVSQVVANEFGVPLSSVRIMSTRTDKVPNTSATAASSGTDLNGMAALNAAQIIKARLTEYLVSQYDVAESDIAFSNGTVTAGETTLSFADLADAAWRQRISLSATGFYKTPEIYYDRSTASGKPFYYYANGAAVCEVIVDVTTGENRVLRTDILHDVGRSLNPAIDIGQIEGGFVQGLGWLTTEELVWRGDGSLATDGPATYKIPAIGDRPVEFNVALLASTPNEKQTIGRSKAVGEPPLMLAIAAHCAIRDAVASVSDYAVFPALNAPATPEAIVASVSGCVPAT